MGWRGNLTTFYKFVSMRIWVPNSEQRHGIELWRDGARNLGNSDIFGVKEMPVDIHGYITITSAMEAFILIFLSDQF